MISTRLKLPALSACALAALLAGCGGGGEGGPIRTPPEQPAAPAPEPLPPAPAGCKIHVFSDTTVELGKTAGATALSCGEPLADIVWTQTAGPAVQLLAARSPTLAIDTAAVGAGVITLRADATLADGSRASASTSITVTAAPAGSFVTVRADHSLRPDTDTSLRAWPTLSGGDTLKSIVWTQTAGPAVTMNTSDQLVLMFKAPTAMADTALRFRATMTTASGRVDSDDVLVGIDPQGAAPAGAIFDVTARVHPYRQVSPYAAVLARCAYDNSLYFKDNGENSLCNVATLPLIQPSAASDYLPTVAQVMDRVLVSHDFLGANFEQFLQTQDPHGDFRRLLGGVSAIVIGSHVRPSFYTAATGAIYLDANNLWLRPEQRDVVTEVPDYRLAFAEALNYSTPGRLVRDNNYVRRSFPATERITRSQDDLVFELGRLLYHELGHAGDFAPPSERGFYPALSVWGNVAPRITYLNLPSDALAATYPLRSAEMKGLGQVLYLGAAASDEQKAYTAADVGGFFASDVASDDYAYTIVQGSNPREDLAMLFEEFMMSYRHNVRYDLAFTNRYVSGTSVDSLVVAWGERGRIAEPAIKPRIKLVLARVAPWIDPATVDSLPAPILMTPGTTWGQNLVLNPSALAKASARRVESPAERIQRGRDDLQGLHAR